MMSNQLNIAKSDKNIKKTSQLYETNEKKYNEIIQYKDKTILTLNKKIKTLEHQLLKNTATSPTTESSPNSMKSENYYLDLLTKQIKKTKQLEDILYQIDQKMLEILNNISERFIMTENTNLQNIRKRINLSVSQSQNQSEENLGVSSEDNVFYDDKRKELNKKVESIWKYLDQIFKDITINDHKYKKIQKNMMEEKSGHMETHKRLQLRIIQLQTCELKCRQNQNNYQNQRIISRNLKKVMENSNKKILESSEKNRELELQLEIQTNLLKIQRQTNFSLYEQLQKMNSSDMFNQLRQSQKQNQKLKGLLERSEHQKNQFMNKISNLTIKDIDLKINSKEEIFQMCKQLFFRLKDIESEKGSIIKEIHKEKEMEAKKYKDILRKLKGVKESNPIHA